MESIKNYEFEFKADSTMIDPSAKNSGKFYFLNIKPPVVYDFKTTNGTLMINEQSVIFKIIDKNTMQLGHCYSGYKTITITTFYRVK